MAQTKELEKIKKEYGERFMQMCRTLFPTLLETEGRLYEILSGTFAGNCKTLYEDIANNGLEEEFKNFIYSKIDVEDKEKKIIKIEVEEKTPYELLEEAGYDLIECKTEDEIQNFKKYYAPREELCTFRGGRLNRCVVFFAVKKDVENIKREDFDRPKREDEYGTSVMGIQFEKHGICTVSIKNRYNHIVNNPDATYGNDLDKITPGLEQSFRNLLRQRGLELNNSNIERFEIPGYTVASDGKYYKYNHEINGIYYCPGNVIIEKGELRKLDPDKKLLIDYFEVDFENKTIKTCDSKITDSFTDDLQEIKKIKIEKIKEEKGARIIIEKEDCEHPVIITIDEDNQIIGYKNENLTEVGDDFLSKNKRLRKIDTPNLTKVGNGFLCCNEDLSELELPKLVKAEDNFLERNRGLRELELPNLTEVGNYFLRYNEDLSELELPKLVKAEDSFLERNRGLRGLELPNLTEVGNYFLRYNEDLSELELPKLVKAEDNFLERNRSLRELELPNLTEVGNYFLRYNEDLSELKLPNLTKARNGFLYFNKNRKNFLKMIKTNKKKQKRKKSKITPNDIAHLDKTAELTTSEISDTQGILEILYEEEKTKESDRDDVK